MFEDFCDFNCNFCDFDCIVRDYTDCVSNSVLVNDFDGNEEFFAYWYEDFFWTAL